MKIREFTEKLLLYPTCEELGITCVRYEQNWHLTDPLNEQVYIWLHDKSLRSHLTFGAPELDCIASQLSIRHCHVIQYALDHYGYDHDDIVVIMDGDIFPIRSLSLRSLLNRVDIAGIYKHIEEQHVSYFWVPFIAMNMPKLPNKSDLRFQVDVIKSCLFDTGSHSYHYLKNNPRVRFKRYDWQRSTSYHNQSYNQVRKAGFSDLEVNFIRSLPWPQCVEFHINKSLLHFAGSSFNLEGHDIKARYLHAFIDDLIQTSQ